MEKTEKKLVSGARIEQSLNPNMHYVFERSDANPETRIMISNSGPGEIQYKLVNENDQRPWEYPLHAQMSAQFLAKQFGNGKYLHIETQHMPARITIDM